MSDDDKWFVWAFLDDGTEDGQVAACSYPTAEKAQEAANIFAELKNIKRNARFFISRKGEELEVAGIVVGKSERDKEIENGTDKKRNRKAERTA